MTIKFSDKSSILLGDVKTTNDGYRLVRSKIARTGIQEYYGREFGGQAAEHGFGDNETIRVYRDPSDVFHKDAVNGWAGVPVTIDHPADLVTPDNVTKYQVGDVRDKAYIDAETGWFGLEWLIRDATAITKFDSGEYPEVSGGYTAIIDWTPGVDPAGQKYDAKQIGITPNHLAMVPRGRAFSDAANWGATPINLEDQKEPKLDMIKIMVGDKAVQVAASDADIVTGLVKDHKTAIDDKDAEIAVLTTKLADAESKILTDEQIAEKAKVMADAESKRAAVKAKVGDKAAEWTDAQVEAAFLAIGSPNDAVRDAIKDAKPKDKSDGIDMWEKLYAKKGKK